MSYLKVILDELIPVLAPFIASALGMIAIWALHKIGAKFKVEASAAQDQVIWDAVQKGVAYAEEQARKKTKVDPAQLTSGEAKLQQALSFVKTQVGEKGYTKIGEEKLTKYLETALNVTRPAK